MKDEHLTLLVVEDDPTISGFLTKNLEADGYQVIVADCAKDGLRLLETKYPDLVLLDVELPDGSGFDLLSTVREADGIVARCNSNVPIVVLSGRSDELDRLRGFERGCDDYLCKPFSYPELRMRIEALLRRTLRRTASGRVRAGRLELNPAAREVKLGGRPIELSQKEFSLLRTLIAEPTKVFSKSELLRSLWGFDAIGSTRTLDSHACRLRGKLCSDGERYVINVWGVGYRLVDGPHEAEVERFRA